MPIDIQSLERAALPLEDRILAMLQAEPTKAFNLYEIVGRVEGGDRQITLMALIIEAASSADKKPMTSRYLESLDGLVRTGRVLRGEVNGSPYWGARK